MFKFFVNFFVFTSIYVLAKPKDLNHCYANNPHCVCDFDSSLVCFDFMSYGELDFSQLVEKEFKPTTLALGSKDRAVLNDSLNVDPIAFNVVYNVSFEEELDYDLSSNPFRNKPRGLELEIRVPTWAFYYKSMILNESVDCLNLLVDKSTNKSKDLRGLTTMFSQFDRVNFRKLNYDSHLCQYMFVNAHLTELSIHSANDLASQKLRFFDIGDNLDVELNATIETLTFVDFSDQKIDKHLLDPYVFKNMRKFSLLETRTNESFDEFLFQPFSKLKYLELNVAKFHDLISVSSKWLKHLNADVSVNLSNQTDYELNKHKFMLLVISQYQFPYAFSDDDLCKFYYFPHHKLVYPLIQLNPNEAPAECTCTLMWLLSRWQMYPGDKNELITLGTQNCLRVTSEEFANKLNSCQLETKFRSCSEYVEDVTTLKSTTTTTKTPTESKESNAKALEKLNANMILLIIVLSALIALLIVIMTGFVFLFRRYRNQMRTPTTDTLKLVERK